MIAEASAAEMDRKNSNRTSSVPPKSGGGVDTKKTENSSGSRPRYGKKQEATSSRQRLDNGVVRKPAPQKCRASTDKRPRSRGFFNDRQREELVDDDRAELGSALHKGSKKGNLNHLLNFTYAPRDNYGGGGGGAYGRRGRIKPRYNKEQFLQANCQFIVREGGDYSIHSADPDKLVDWDLVEQVRVSSSELPSCPICLHPPIAAKITRCGHIYCWSCILHYLALGEKSWRKCPICYDAIHGAHLKSVQTVCVPRYKAGEEITFQLMKKEKGSTQVFPNLYWMQRDGKPLSVQEAACWPSANLLVASVDDVNERIIEPERRALERQLAANPEESEVCFIETALTQLKERILRLKRKKAVKGEVTEMLEKLQIEKQGEQTVEQEENVSSIPHEKPIVQYSSAFSDEEEEVDETQESSQGEDTLSVDPNVNGDSVDTEITNEGVNTGHAEEVSGLEESEDNSLPVEEAMEYLAISPEEFEESPRPQQNTFYYFYQAVGGEHIYIHAVNARCLVRDYGSLENCPENITATIVEIETVFMTEELRRRLRYLCHLPLTCEFQVAEVQLKPPVVSTDTLATFSGELERRQHLRQRKCRDERKHSRKIEQQEKQKQGIYPGLRIPLTSRSQFPATLDQQSEADYGGRVNFPVPSPTNFSPLDSPTELNVLASEFIPGGVSLSPSSPPAWPAESNSMSFATMLKEGKPMPRVWPKAVKTGEESGVGDRLGRRRTDSDVSDPEDKVPVPVYQSAFQDAIQQAFDNLDKGSEVNLKQPESGRKKKKQKKLLFTTTMTRGK